MCDVHAAERKRDPERERIYSAILIFHAVFETNLKVFFFWYKLYRNYGRSVK